MVTQNKALSMDLLTLARIQFGFTGVGALEPPSRSCWLPPELSHNPKTEMWGDCVCVADRLDLAMGTFRLKSKAAPAWLRRLGLLVVIWTTGVIFVFVATAVVQMLMAAVGLSRQLDYEIPRAPNATARASPHRPVTSYMPVSNHVVCARRWVRSSKTPGKNSLDNLPSHALRTLVLQESVVMRFSLQLLLRRPLCMHCEVDGKGSG